VIVQYLLFGFFVYFALGMITIIVIAGPDEILMLERLRWRDRILLLVVWPRLFLEKK
jgi:hypothetical protein